MKASTFDQLFDRWGDHNDALLRPYINGCGISILTDKGKNRTRRGTREFLRKTRRQVIGRAYRVYNTIRTMEQF